MFNFRSLQQPPGFLQDWNLNFAAAAGKWQDPVCVPLLWHWGLGSWCQLAQPSAQTIIDIAKLAAPMWHVWSIDFWSACASIGSRFKYQMLSFAIYRQKCRNRFKIEVQPCSASKSVVGLCCAKPAAVQSMDHVQQWQTVRVVGINQIRFLSCSALQDLFFLRLGHKECTKNRRETSQPVCVHVIRWWWCHWIQSKPQSAETQGTDRCERVVPLARVNVPRLQACFVITYWLTRY